jgi:hypothetical protein
MELPLGCTPQGNIELMPKKEILKLNSAPRLEQVGDNCPKQMEHRNHRVDDELILPYRANRADGIFGNDTPITAGPAARVLYPMAKEITHGDRSGKVSVLAPALGSDHVFDCI